MAQADGSLTQIDYIHSIKILGTNWLVSVAYGANGCATLHLNDWLAFVRSVHSE